MHIAGVLFPLVTAKYKCEANHDTVPYDLAIMSH